MNNLFELLNYRKVVMNEERVFHYFNQLINIIKYYTIFKVQIHFTLKNIFFKDNTYNKLFIIEMNYFQTIYQREPNSSPYIYNIHPL